MPEITPTKFVVHAGWDDVPHLDEKTKRELMAATPPHLRKARAMGIPSLGAGAIYPVDEEEITVGDFRLPSHFTRGYALDVGWNRTAVAFMAHDPDNDTDYVYGEYYRGQAEPAVHAMAIKGRGAWLTGAIDPASRGRNQHDGTRMLDLYKRAQLNLILANNAVEAGIYQVWERLSTGRLKVFASCTNLLAEYRIYRRDEHGKIVKKNDHLMDCVRYGVNTRRIFQPLPAQTSAIAAPGFEAYDRAMGW